MKFPLICFEGNSNISVQLEKLYFKVAQVPPCRKKRKEKKIKKKMKIFKEVVPSNASVTGILV